MFDRMANYFRQKFGADALAAEPTAENHADAHGPASGGKPAGFSARPVPMSLAQGHVQEQLRVAMSFFTNGYREEAMPFCEQILKNQAADASKRVVAHCLLGEIFRGKGDFGRAQQQYELAIRESDSIPESRQALDEFVRHYRPRAFCGLLTVYRRTLFDDHEKIRKLLTEIKSDFSLFAIEDLPAQVNLMEGLYLRQLGDVEVSIACISEGLESVRNASTPYFLFLHPEHFEALLLISHLCLPGNNVHVRKLSREILKATRGPWSLAFAAAAQLHLHFRQAANGEFTHFGSNEFGQEREKAVELMTVFQKNARFENDPLLLTECSMLSLVWHLLVEDFSQARRELVRLKNWLADGSPPLVLLRAVELGSLRHELEIAGLQSDSAIEFMLELGRGAFAELSKPLRSYGCADESCRFWKSLLAAEPPRRPNGFILEIWASNEITELRNRVWP